MHQAVQAWLPALAKICIKLHLQVLPNQQI
jgi:hypothetical protein